MARTEEGLSYTAKSIETAGGSALFIAADVCDYKSAVSAVRMATEAFGQLDILVNNAGDIAPIGLLAVTDAVEWTRCINVNLVGSYNMARAALEVFLGQRNGVVVNEFRRSTSRFGGVVCLLLCQGRGGNVDTGIAQ